MSGMNIFVEMKHCLILFTIIYSVIGNAQYSEFPKLESLYNSSKFDKCIEKANEEVVSNNKELYPYYWLIKCYIAIDELEEEHPLKKSAITKALNIALKLKKKDSKGQLISELVDDIKTIEEKTLIEAEKQCKINVTKSNDLFQKLAELSDKLSIKYKQYLCKVQNNDATALKDLVQIIETNYLHFKTNNKAFENMDYAYAELMSEYIEMGQNDKAYRCLLKSKEANKISKFSDEVWLKYLNNLDFYLSEESSTAEFNRVNKLLYQGDSLFNEKTVKSTIIIVNELEIKSNLLVLKNEDLSYKSSERFYLIKNKNLDSFNQLNQGIYNFAKSNKYYDLQIFFKNWVSFQSKYKKTNMSFADIQSVYQSIYNSKSYVLCLDLLKYCRQAYPKWNKELTALNVQLDKTVNDYVANSDNSKNTDKINELSDNFSSKSIKDKQYQNYIKKLETELKNKHFSSFSVNIRKALSIFPNDPKLLALKKEYIIKDYINYKHKVFYSTQDSLFTKKPDYSKCYAGTVSDRGNNVVIETINYCRRLAGINDSCVLDPDLNKKCQAAALMMSANGDLNHHPPKSWKCYTQIGYDAASSSNLSLGHAFEEAVLGQMEDFGSNNYSCGHRRWILNPYNTVFAHGSTEGATSIWSFGSSNIKLKKTVTYNVNTPVCWPASDYFPSNLMAERWSFSLSSADFNSAKVSVTENGKPIKVKIEPISNGYGQNTLVFIPEISKSEGKIYTVTITNVMVFVDYGSSVSKNFTYKVMPLKIEE